ncbi:unnamed protein product [Choristocarpus tenellus]
MQGDFFSSELEGSLTSVAPAFPMASFVKADSQNFLR